MLRIFVSGNSICYCGKMEDILRQLRSNAQKNMTLRDYIKYLLH